MTEDLDAAHEAYRRLKWQEENRPDPEKLKELKEANEQEDRSRKVMRFRSKIA